MNITEVRVRKIYKEEESKLKAIVSITVDNWLAIHDLKVIEANGKLFVAMPSRKDVNGVFRDTVHPIGKEARDYLEKEVLGVYFSAIEETR